MDVTIFTPERQLPSHKADSLVVPAHDGQRGFLLGHTAMVCQLGSGKLTIDHSTEPSVVYVVDGGTVQIDNDEVTILAESATLEADISETSLIEELKVLDSADYDSPTALAQAKAKAHWIRTQLHSAGKDVPETSQV